jgi:polyisoprenoid-binding protein YceI
MNVIKEGLKVMKYSQVTGSINLKDKTTPETLSLSIIKKLCTGQTFA